MLAEAAIPIFCALTPIQVAILGLAMKQQRREKPLISSAVCIVLTVLFVVTLSFLALYLRGKVSADLLSYMTIGLTAIIVIIAAIDYVLRQKESKESKEKLQMAKYETNKGLVIAKYFVSILEGIEKRDLQLKDDAVKQYKSLFSLKEFMTLLNAIASTDAGYVKFMGMGVKDEELKQDKIQKRHQIDNLFGKLYPAMKKMTFEGIVAYGNKLDTFPKMQNNRYKGIKTRRGKDRQWKKLFTILSNVKAEYPNIFAENTLDSMINDYTNMSFGGSSICFAVELVNWYIPIDVLPTAYIDTGAYAPYVEMQNRMVKLREDITNKIIELATKSDEEQKMMSKDNAGSDDPKTG